MSTGSILLGFALFLLVAFFLAYPFLLPARRQRAAAAHSTRQQLLAEKELLLTRMQVLDFDHETGKIPDDIYEVQRLALKTAAASVLQRLDRMPADALTAAGHDEIEMAVSRLRQRAGKISPLAAATDEIEAAIAQRRRQAAPATPQSNGQPGVAARFCPQCGQATDPGDKFCAHCGAALAQPVAAA